MTYKKTWLSYILWFLFACITGILLADYAILLWKIQISSNSNIYTVGFIFIIFAFVAGLYLLIRKTLAEPLKNHKINEHTALMWEIFAVLCIFSIALLYRFYCCIQNWSDVTTTQFYDMAVVRKGIDVGTVVHGASYIYVRFLSFIFAFLGNKVMAAVWMQVFIEMITILLSYFTIKKMLGRIPACIVMLMMSVSSIYIGQLFILTPEVMFFFIYLLGLYITGSYVRAYCDNRLSVNFTILGAVFSGIVIGVLTYLDVISITLFIIIAGLITGINKRAENTEKKSFSFLLVLICAIVCLLSVTGALALDAHISGDSIEVVSKAWFNLYNTAPTIHFSINSVIFQSSSSFIEGFIRIILAALLILSFRSRSKNQNSTPWICLMLILTPIVFIGAGVLSYQIYYVFIWSVLAGIGLQQSLIVGEAENSSTVQTPLSSEVENSTVKEPLNSDSENLNIQLPLNSAETINNVERQTQLNPEPQKPRFIENPLPLPKKHEKKEMDYQYEVTEDKMKFDIEIAHDDDFDQ